MNTITDLTARAISFITAVQTTFLNGEIDLEKGTEQISILNISQVDFESKFQKFVHFESDVKSGEYKKSQEDNFNIRAIELVWVSSKTLDVQQVVDYAIQLCVNLVKWIWDNQPNGIFEQLEPYGRYPTPYNWRKVLSNILYEHPDERVRLASALQYLPLQVVLAVGGGAYDSRGQRILQMWKISDDDRDSLLNNEEIKILNQFKLLVQQSGIDAEILLINDHELSNSLIGNNAPLSFELIFSEELKEIETNRIRRIHEEVITDQSTVKNGQIDTPVKNNGSNINDPFKKVKQMGVYALALSGGGIRSATFNLGILQGLAQKKLIGKFDYLSTVSGGGYIGSWLTAWIKREGSLVKVSNRLCPDKSPDPTGEELRPIKWLRMFSNYFAPRASIMSADSWTLGITWLRNTLLNQVVIFLLLLSMLFLENLLYLFWSQVLVQPRPIDPTLPKILGWSTLQLIPAILAGVGMHAYHSENFRLFNVRRENNTRVSKAIITIAILAAFFISAWLSSNYYEPNPRSSSLLYKIKIFWPAAGFTVISLSIVAFFGNYADCIRDFKKKKKSFFAWPILISTALISSAIGLFFLATGSVLLMHMHDITIPTKPLRPIHTIDKSVLQFIFGLPLVVEVFSITIVARMALLGKYFPDERREWWGRIGAYIHRVSFLWILVSTSALIGKELIIFGFDISTSAVAATGGWVALVGVTVRAAFSSQTSGTGDQTSTFSKFLSILSKVGPYVFALGLLILLPGLIKPIITEENIFLKNIGLTLKENDLNAIGNALTLIIFIVVAYLLARQLGVNEFSMYNFYRNRLVRAYLGATRRSTDRQRTANPFTGFDMLDDEKLYKLTNEFGYYGPYPILNCALNASQEQELDRQDRKAESFIFSPLFCGFDFSMARSSADKIKSYDYAYRQTPKYAFDDGGPSIGTAMAISGAAVNPNQGYHSSAATAFLLTIFNVQIGRWIGNPRKNSWQRSDPRDGLSYIISNLVNKTSTRNKFVALSDGGHFDNMGLYEMVRRKCPYIILCDAEQDDQFTCEGFANAIRRCRIDFGAEIKIDISKITDRPDGRHSLSHYALGEITYVGDNQTGILLYIKSSIHGNEPVDVYEYALKNKTFPHQTTADQFFDEDQFESYRKLGLHIAELALGDNEVVKAFKFDYKINLDDRVLETIARPFKEFFTTFKSFFTKKK